MGLFRRLVRKALAKIAVESGGPNLKQKMSAPLSAMADHVERLDRRVSEHPMRRAELGEIRGDFGIRATLCSSRF
jgi:hypothetical protein